MNNKDKFGIILKKITEGGSVNLKADEIRLLLAVIIVLSKQKYKDIYRQLQKYYGNDEKVIAQSFYRDVETNNTKAIKLMKDAVDKMFVNSIKSTVNECLMTTTTTYTIGTIELNENFVS